MRRLLPVLAALLTLTACTGGGDDDQPTDEAAPSTIAVDWPVVSDDLTPDSAPAVPEGFDENRYVRMVEALTAWANASTVDPEVRESDDPVAAVAAVVPDAVGKQITEAAEQSAAPHLVAANVFGPDVELLSDPQVTTAWKLESFDEGGLPALRLQLQTRAAYTVRDGDGPQRVVGVLRVHELVTREGETGGIGVGLSWQEFGASDCRVAIDDVLRPDAGKTAPDEELVTFVQIGSSPEVSMPELPVEDALTDDFLDRCKRGAV